MSLKLKNKLKYNTVNIKPVTLSSILREEQVYREETGTSCETIYLYDSKVSEVHKRLKDKNITSSLVEVAEVLMIEKTLRRTAQTM